MGFYQLFCKCIDINDFQVIEELFSVAYGLALSQNVPSDYLKVFSEWILENVFSKDGLYRYENIVIRYYAQGIVKRSIKEGISDRGYSNLIKPIYNYDPNRLELFEKAILSERMSGYNSIDYDLSRYVLCDKMEHFFKGWSTSIHDTDQELEHFKDKYQSYTKVL